MANAGITTENAAGTRMGATSNTQTGKPKFTGPEMRAYYLRGLPKTVRDFQQSDSLIVDNYNKLGFLYLEELNDTTGALKTYLALQAKYPDNQYRLQNWYYLYKIYAGLGKTDKSMYYKNFILARYPGSLYAKVLNDPDYYKKLENKHNEAEKLYSRTYQAFGHEQYYRVITYANRALEQYPNDTTVVPQFMYLRALSLGKVEVPDTLYLALQQLIAKYPHHPLAERSKAIVRMLQMEYGIGISEKERQALLAAQNRKKNIGGFVYNNNAPQYILLVTNRRVVNTRALETRLSDFNEKYFRQQPLQISSLILNNNYNLLLVKQFISQQDAMVYYKGLSKDPYVFSGIQKRNYHLFVISDKNYPLFYKEKNVKIYQQFFDEYYK